MLLQKKSAALTALVLLITIGSVLSTAQVTYPNFPNSNGLTFNGSTVLFPAENPQVLRLTTAGQQHVTGTAWATQKQSVGDGFTSIFKFRISQDGLPADGLAFVVQNSAAALQALGGSGGAIGYGLPDEGDIGTPIDHSLAVEIDTYQNGFDPDANHIAVQSCGTLANSQNHNSTCKLGLFSPNGVNLSDGQVHTLIVDYDPGTLRIFLDDFGAPVLTITELNIADLLGLPTDEDGTRRAYVGFTGSVGLVSENNDILSWNFTPGTTTTTITQTVPQATNQQTDVNYVFGSYNYKVEYFNSTVDKTVSVTAIPIDQLAFHNARLAGTPFSSADCAIYQGTGGKCLLFRVECTVGADCSTFDYEIFNNFNSDFTISGAGVLKAPIGTNDWQNIIKTFVQTRLDPGTRSGSKGFSDFIIVQNATAPPTVTFTSPAPGGFYPAGQSIPVSFTCVADPLAPLVTVTDCNGTIDGVPVSNPGTFTSSVLGPHTIAVTTGDSVLNSVTRMATFNIGIAPAFTSGNTTTFTKGVAGSFNVTATGTPTPTIALTGGTLPPGVTFNGSVLGGTPTQSGTFPLTFTATNGVSSVSQPFTLIVLGPQATISPTSLNFGTVKFLTLSVKSVTVKNTGTLPLNISGVQVIQGTSDWDDYFFINFCPSTLSPGKSCPIAVFFFADDLGVRTATLNVYNNSSTNPLQVSLTGTVKK
jgi:Legume lectin domain